jgi:hypothetical protein
MDVSTPPSLNLACPQAKSELGKHDNHHIYQGTNHNRQQLPFI